MDEVQEPAEGLSQRLFRCIARPDDRLLKHSLDAETGERRARGKNAFFGIAHQHWSERPEGHLVRLEDMDARVQGKNEAVAPSAARHFRSLTRVLRRQFVVERDDDGLFTGEIAIQESDADPRFFRDIPKGCRFIAARGDELHRRAIQAAPRRGTLGGLTRRTAPFSWLDILSEHVH